MGQIRHAVFDLDFLRGFAEIGLGVPGLRGGSARRRRQFAETLQQFFTAHVGQRPKIPIDLQRITAQLRRPEMLGHHRHAAGHLHHLVHAGNRQRCGAFEGFHRGTEHRGAGDHRGHQAFKLHVHAELGAAGDLFRGVEALGRFADDFPVLGLLEGDGFRIRHRQLPGGIGQFAVGRALIPGDDHAGLRANRRRRDVEAFRSRFHEHLPRRRPGQSVAVEFHPGRRRAAGDLHAAKRRQAVIGRRGWRVLHADFRPVGVQFFGDQHGQAGPDALAHFRMAEQHGDAVVRRDAQERVGREGLVLIFCRPGKAIGPGHHERHHQAAA